MAERALSRGREGSGCLDLGRRLVELDEECRGVVAEDAVVVEHGV
jgi:hypothetical protein